MNIKEIEQIEDVELRKIRIKYWNLRHKAFLDEHGISDQEVGNVLDSLTKEEEEEVSRYLKTQEEKEDG